LKFSTLIPILFFFCFGNGQELPPITNFTSFDYSGENQNWAAAQISSNQMYFANNSSLLEFDGEQWKKYPSPNGSVIRALAVANDLVYTGCYMEFGYWAKNRLGVLVYHSLTKELGINLLNDEQFWNITAVENSILFQSLRRVYKYNSADKSVRIIEVPTTKAKTFNLNSGIYLQKQSEGIFKIENDKLSLISDHPDVRHKTLISLFDHGTAMLCLMEDAQFYEIDDNGQVSPWQISASSTLNELSIYSGIQLSNGDYILGTIADGIYHLSQSGEFIQKINQQKGLTNNTVLNMYEDQDANLWLAHDNGISILNLDSPFKEYIDNLGRLGVVYTAINFNGFLYLGTNQGLFYKSLNSKENFTLIPETEGQVWQLVVIDDTLFCGHNNGTFLITANQAEQISKLPGTWNIKPLPSNPNYLIQGNYNGLSVLEKQNGNWTFLRKLSGFNTSSRFFEFYHDDRIMVNNEYKGLFKLEIDEDLSALTAVTSENARGYGSSLIKYLNKILYATNNAIYQIDQKNHDIVLDTTLTQLFFTEKEKLSSILIPDAKSNKVWSFSDQNLRYLGLDKFGSKPTLNNVLLPDFLRNRLGVSGFENINNLRDREYLIGTSNGYVTLNLDKIRSDKYRIDLTEVSKEYFDKPATKIALDSTALENLPFGEYSFKARAKVGDTLTDNTISFDFKIQRPWYWSYAAILGYVLGFVLLSFFIHKRYKTYYKKQQELVLLENKRKEKRKKIKTQKEMVQLKNEKLEQEIESKNRELAVSTMSIIKKNEFLNSIKKQLHTAENPTQIKAVIKTIDRNINNEDDWKFFETAFNNADKSFLKKIKELHPQLTSNDLRLCAYLRLNLSSKEIAPLLNISIKSVEVKRYRLRKKMELPRESSLTEHILSI